MPIHKNLVRDGQVTLTFSGSYTRTDSDWAASEVTQDWFSVTEANAGALVNTAVKIITFLDDENGATTPRINSTGNTLVLPWTSQDGADNRDVRSAAQTAIVVHGWLASFDSTVNVEVDGGTDLDFVGKFDWVLTGSVITGVQKVGAALIDDHPIHTSITPFFLNTGRAFTGDQGANFYSTSRNTVTFEIAATGGSSTIFSRGDIMGTGTGFVPGARVSTEIDIRFDDTFPISGDRTVFQLRGFAEGDLGTGVAENDTSLRFIFIGGTSGLDNDGARLEIFFGNSGDTTLIQWIDGIVDIITNNAGTRTGGADQSVLSYTASRVGVDTLRLTAKAGTFWPAFPLTTDTTTGYLSTVTNQEFSEFSVSCATDTISGAVMTWVSSADVEQVSSVPADILFVEAAGGSGASNVGVVLEDVGYTHVVDSSAQSGTITLNSGTWVDLGFSELTEVISGVTVLVNESFFQFGEIAKTNEVGVPAWTGSVSTVYSSGADTLVQLNVQTGSAALTAAIGDDGTLINSSILDRLFVQQRPNIELGVLDGVVSGGANNGYTFFGDVTNADFFGDVEAGSISQNVITSIDINIGTSTSAGQQGFTIDGFPAGSIVPSDNTRTSLRFQNDNTTGFFNSGSSVNIFSVPDTAVNTDWIDQRVLAVNDPTLSYIPNVSDRFRPQVADYFGFTASRVGDDTLRLTFKRTAGIPSGTSLTLSSNQFTASITNTTTGDVRSSSTLSFDLDPNRSGGNNGVQFTDETVDNDHNNWGNISWARGATVTLDKGFTLELGRGYDLLGDAKDGVLTIKENSQLMLSFDSRDDIWGGKDGAAFIRTVDHPFTVNKQTGGQITMANITRFRGGAGGQNVTFLNGENVAATSSNLNSLIFNIDNAGTGFYANSEGFYYPMPGVSINNQVVIDTNSGNTYYEPSPNIKQFQGDKVIHNSGRLLFNASPGLFGVVADFDFASQWIAADMDFSGTIVENAVTVGTPLGAFQSRRNNFYFVDLTRLGLPYVGDWTWNQGGGLGRVRMARRWNPSWVFRGSSITGIYESYYYQDKDQTSLVTVKEGGERGVIGTANIQSHPFEAGINISTTTGLADVSLTNSQSNYKPDSDDWDSSLPGLCLTYLDGTVPTGGGHVDVFNSTHGTAFSYTRRHGFRPYFTNIDMSIEKELFTSQNAIDPLLDPYWQATTVAEIDAYADAIIEGNMLVNASLRFIVSTSGASNWNDIYREIEFRENKGNISDGSISNETRAYDSVNNLNGRFRRLIDTNNPVSSGSLMRIIQGETHMTINTAVGISTENNAISGIDCGAQDLVIASVSGVSRDMTGELKTTGDIVLSTRNLGTSLVWKNSELTSDSLQITSLAGIGNSVNNHLDNCVLNVNTLTFGGSAADEAGTVHSESTASDYAVDNSTINVVNALTFKDKVDRTIINITDALTFEDIVDRSTVNTNSNVSLGANTSENRIGLTSSRAGIVNYSNATGTSTTDTVHCTSLIIPKTVVGCTFDSSGTITSSSLVNTCDTSNITGNVITLGDTDKCNIDGLSNTVTLESVVETTITNASDITVEGLDKSSNVTATGTFTCTGDVSDSTITAAIIIINTTATSFTGDIAFATATTSATILTLGD